MSYTIAKSLSYKDGVATMSCASSNVYPKTFVNHSVKMDEATLLEYLDGMELQPNESANKYRWAYIKAMLGGIEGELRLGTFKAYLKYKEPEGRYVIKTNRGYVRSMSKGRKIHWLTYTHDITEAKTFGYFEAVVKVKKFPSDFEATARLYA